ncbi:MAG: tetratricopeptide repeat protein [Bacteroidetes bacterium]|nr:tetratricopeptide repeat protein [Bacteroidota bacterium]
MDARYLILFIAFTLLSVGSNSQSTLLEQVSTQSNDRLQEVYLYLRLANEAKSVDAEQALSYTRQALQLANIISSLEARAEANELMGELYQMMNNFQPSINYFLISGKLYESLGKKENLAGVYSKLGMLYINNNYNLESAQYYFQKLLDLGIELNNQKIIAEAYNQIGGIFFRQESYDEANHYNREALKLWEQARDNEGISTALNNIGEIYHMKGSYNTALDYFNQSLSISEHIGNKDLIAANYKNIGLVKSHFGEIDEAFEYFDLSLKLYKETNNIENQVSIMLTIGDQYFTINEYKKAYQEYIQVYRIATKSNHWKHIADAAFGLSRTADEMRNYKLSLQYFQIYAAYNDSIVLRQKMDRITELQSRFREDLQEKELLLAKKELALSENQNKLNTLKLNLLILSLFFILIISFLILNRYRSKARKERLIREKDTQLHTAQRELMEIDIQAKDNDLINFALHLVQKNEMLQHLQKELKKLPCNSDEETIQRISELNAAIKHNLSLKEDYEEFKHKLDDSYNDFFIRLRTRFPNLTRNEERLCAFLRLNLSSKEIAAINNTSVKAAEMSRYRLRKKIGLEFNDLLPEYLQNI